MQQLQKSLGEAEEDKRGIDGRLSSAQTALVLQEETIRRSERERRVGQEKNFALEQNLKELEATKKNLEVKNV